MHRPHNIGSPYILLHSCFALVNTTIGKFGMRQKFLKSTQVKCKFTERVEQGSPLKIKNRLHTLSALTVDLKTAGYDLTQTDASTRSLTCDNKIRNCYAGKTQEKMSRSCPHTVTLHYVDNHCWSFPLEAGQLAHYDHVGIQKPQWQASENKTSINPRTSNMTAHVR
jgi:hypothetical protein